MLTHPTHEQLIQLRLFGMAKTLAEQNQMPDAQQMSFEERLAMMVDREMTERENRLTSNRLRRARLKQPAVAEDIDYRHPRGLDKTIFRRLLMGDWVTDNSLSNVIFMVQYYHEMQKRFRRSVARPSCASGYAPASG